MFASSSDTFQPGDAVKMKSLQISTQPLYGPGLYLKTLSLNILGLCDTPRYQ